MKILIANIGSTSFKYRLLETRGRGGPGPGQGRAHRPARRATAPTTTRPSAAASTRSSAPAGRSARSATSPPSASRPCTPARSAGRASWTTRCSRRWRSSPSWPRPTTRPTSRRCGPSAARPVAAPGGACSRPPSSTPSTRRPRPGRSPTSGRGWACGATASTARATARRASGPRPCSAEADLRHVSCHLGGSSSVAAIRSGVAVDTSFGLSPQSGLPQNNRVGDIDAFAALFVMKKLGLDADAMARVLANESGLAGISGGSGDVRDLEAAAAAGDARARLALDVFVRGGPATTSGAFLVGLGGLDVLSFSGGIGENSAAVRSGRLRRALRARHRARPGTQRGRAGRVGAVPGRGAGRRPARARGRGAHRRARGRRGRARQG